MPLGVTQTVALEQIRTFLKIIKNGAVHSKQHGSVLAVCLAWDVGK